MWSGTTNPTCAKKSLFNLLESEEKPLELLRPEDVCAFVLFLVGVLINTNSLHLQYGFSL